MPTKLILSIDEEKVKRIKQYSKEKGISVSKIVEEHIDKITCKNSSPKLDIMKIKGAFDKVPKDFDVDKAKWEYLKEKHGL